MAVIYDRVFKVPVWLVFEQGGKRANEVTEMLVAEKLAHVQPWPAKSFIDTVNDLGKKGWHHVVGQKFPYNVDVGFLSVALNRHVKAFFGESALLQGAHEKPYQIALNRHVKSPADYERLFNDALAMEQDVGLSQLFQLGTPKAPVYVSGKDAKLDMIRRLSHDVLTVSESGGSIETKGKKTEDIFSLILDSLQQRNTQIHNDK